MAKRHIQVPAEPATFTDPMGRTLSATWADVMHTFFRDPRFLQAMDYEERARVRAAFLKAEAGSVLVIDEEQWKTVAELAKRPTTINPDLFDGEGGAEMFDRIRNATTKHPHDKQAKGPKKASAGERTEPLFEEENGRKAG